jgi:hypothetical protein
MRDTHLILELAGFWVFAQSCTLLMEQDDNQADLLRLFEGAWLASPSARRCYAKVIKGKLLIPYSRNEENKLAGHHFNCQVVGNKLVCRFERFDPYAAGVLFLKLGPNRTLKGGWWLNENIPKAIQDDISQISDNLPEMVRSVWVLMPKAKTPAWAKEYFLKDSSD